MRPVLALLLAAASPAWAADHLVEVTDGGFVPDTLEIGVGDTIIWVFYGPSSQSTTAAAGQADDWDSGVVIPNVFWTRQYDIPGTFTFYDQTFGSDDGGGVVSGVSGSIEVVADSDGDGLDDTTELDLGLDPANEDTDGDGLLDGEEVLDTGTDPLLPDTDGDTLTDLDELDVFGTDPLLLDTDQGTVDDGAEVAAGTDPLAGADDLPPSVLSVLVGPIIGGANVVQANHLTPGLEARLYKATRLTPEREVALCAPLMFDMRPRDEVQITTVAADGTATFMFETDPALVSGSRYLQVVQYDICKLSTRLDLTF